MNSWFGCAKCSEGKNKLLKVIPPTHSSCAVDFLWRFRVPFWKQGNTPAFLACCNGSAHCTLPKEIKHFQFFWAKAKLSKLAFVPTSMSKEDHFSRQIMKGIVPSFHAEFQIWSTFHATPGAQQPLTDSTKACGLSCESAMVLLICKIALKD